MENCNKIDLFILNLLPNEVWAIVFSFLPRVSRLALSKLHGFEELIENVTYLEEKKLYNALRTGSKLYWRKVKQASVCMQSRLKHGAVSFNNEIFIFGGASTNSAASGNYNDLWIFNDPDKFRRMKTSSQTFPSPKSNFGMTNMKQKIFIVGGKSSVGGSAIEQPYSSIMSAFEIHSLDARSGVWHKTLTTGNENEPRISNGIRCVMLSNQELVTVAGLVPIFHNWDAMHAEENVHYRTSLQVSLLKFGDDTLEKGVWYSLADIQNHRRGFPLPRTESHLVNLGNDCILMFGGRSINSSCQDAWIMKISRNPYALKWYQITVDNPLVPPLPTHIFPSCVIQDLLVFTGVRTSIFKKPESDKQLQQQQPPQPQPQRNSNNESQRSPSSSHHQQSPGSSIIRHQQQQQQQPEMRRIFINSERPLNTIGAMSAFSVPAPPVIPQKVLKIQISRDPSPSPPPPQLSSSKPARTRDYPMRVFCLDLCGVFNCTDEMLRENKLSVRWLTLKNNGLYYGAPELRALCTFNRLDNGITLIGGVKRNQTEDDDIAFTQATNEVFMLTYSNDDET